MKKSLYLLVALLALVSCNQKPTLQKYFVEHSEKKSFSTIDIAPGLLESNKLGLSADEKVALKSMHKFNVLFFKIDQNNKPEFEQEKKNVKAVLKEDAYEELMSFGSNKTGASLSTKGTGDKIDEFVVFVHNSDTGFGVVRVLGKDMTPNNVMTIAGILQKSNFDSEQLKPLKELLKK
jgi:hypothetical protein